MGARKVLEGMLPPQVNATLNSRDVGMSKDKDVGEEQQLPEIWAYLGILIQVGVRMQ